MSRYLRREGYVHGSGGRLGVLLVNLGTPDAPTTAAVRRYLAEFLWDPRIVRLPRAIWWLILHGVILRLRPRRSAHAYQQIWTDGGSPLMVYSQQIAAGMRERLTRQLPGPVVVELGMTYGNPSIHAALKAMHDADVRRLLVLPLYPQYSGPTTAAVFDKVMGELAHWRWVPEVRFINDYHSAPGYIDAVVASIREHWQTQVRQPHLLFSFHSIQTYHLMAGDPYFCFCHATARSIAERLGLERHEWSVSFQSRVGFEEWLQPYTETVLNEYALSGPKRLSLVCPGFAVDCLETLEENAIRNRASFLARGGEAFDYIPSLNARTDHIDFLAALAAQQCSGWPETLTVPDAAALAIARERALALGAGQ